MPAMPTRAEIGAFTRRYRRPLAAACAAGAALVVVGSLASPEPPVTPTTPMLDPGQVAMPISLTLAGQALTARTLIDIVAVPDDGARPWIVTRGNTVIESSAPTIGGSSAATTVLISVTEDQALQLASAAGRGSLTALLHLP